MNACEKYESFLKKIAINIDTQYTEDPYIHDNNAKINILRLQCNEETHKQDSDVIVGLVGIIGGLGIIGGILTSRYNN